MARFGESREQGSPCFSANYAYEGEYYGENVDPIAVAKHICDHAQSFAGANLGVRVVGSSALRVGTGSDGVLTAAEAELKEARRIKKVHTDARTAETKLKQSLTKSHDATIKARQATSKQRLETLQALRKNGAPAAQIAAAQTARNAAVQAVKSAQDAKKRALAPVDAELVSMSRSALAVAGGMIDRATAKVNAAKEKVQADGGAWKLLWWDTPDCLQSMQEAFDEVDYGVGRWSGWNEDRSKILKEIRVLPRVGRKQDFVVIHRGRQHH